MGLFHHEHIGQTGSGGDADIICHTELGDHLAHGIQIALQNGLVQAALVTANGGSILTPDENGIPKFTADSEKSLKAYNFFLDMIRTDGSVYTEGGVSQSDTNIFKSGTVAMEITYANRSDAFSKTEGLEYGIILPPKGPDATQYASDKNWATPYCMFKGHANPAGVAQVLSYYLCPSYGMSSAEQAMKLEADAQLYFQDNESIKILKDAIAKNITVSYMAYWDFGLNGVGHLTTLPMDSWLNGESTPELDYAAKKEALNIFLAEKLGY